MAIKNKIITIDSDQMKHMRMTFMWDGVYVRLRLTEEGASYLCKHPELLTLEMCKEYEGSDDGSADG
ncbi:hypothetical protein LCGC14_1124610 [marine sediment metagenome]|uniref:Uncharacterized protein n=1 Tax=marine sediment metagenome TaxID=412755 RepID=A0A0F9K1N7_9ZZZZ